jgi:hypothetical protein
MRPCCIEGCDQEVKLTSRSGMCTQCSSSLYYWAKKRPAQVLARRARLGKYTNRLAEFFNDEGKREKPRPQKGRGNHISARARAESRPRNTRLN